MNLFIDDERYPPNDGNSWIIVRNYEEAIAFLKAHTNAPQHVSFDNDLGGAKEGYDIAKWMVEYDIKLNMVWIPINFSFFVHSQNPVAAKAITNLLERYLDFRMRC